MSDRENIDELEKMKAMENLMNELSRGFQSGEEEGWLSEADVEAHFSEKKRYLPKQTVI